MRILVASPIYPPNNSGLANAALNLVDTLNDLGHDVYVATGCESNPDSSSRIYVFRVAGCLNIRRMIQGETEKYLSFVRSLAPDLVICCAWHCWSTELLLLHKDKANIKQLWLYSHGSASSIRYSGRPFFTIFRTLMYLPYFFNKQRLYKSVDRLICLNLSGESSRFEDVSYFSNLGGKISCIPNQYPAYVENKKIIDQTRLELPDQYILSVGYASFDKGLHRVLIAYSKSSYFNKVPIIFCSQVETEYSRYIIGLSKKLGIKSGLVLFKFGLKGYALYQLYLNALFLAVGSYTECQPLVVIDSHCASLPFVSFNTGDLSKKKSGLVAENQSEFNRMFNLLCDHKLRKNLSRFCILDKSFHEPRMVKALVSDLIRE